jgi:hypothetical protein
MILHAAHENIGKSLVIASAKAVGVGAATQRLIPAGERSSLLTRIAAKINAVRADEMLSAFVELESAILRSRIG